MAENLLALSYYAAPLAIIYGTYLWRHSGKQTRNSDTLQEAHDTGMSTPPSLHPVVDPTRCIGCEACVHACPEFPAHSVLGIIDGKSHLISPTDCIGHGACRATCPVDAITLVFGTSERGIDIPAVSPRFETNIPGIYIAGELGGMGLIRNAVEQGRQALNYLAEDLQPVQDALDVVIVGAGPAGFAATLAAHEKGLRYATIEQNSLGGTVAGFPRGKLVMTAPVELPLYGRMQFHETRKEELMAFWQQVAEQTGISINHGEKLEGLAARESGFEITTSRGSYRAARVLLALGRRGTPRTLGVPGEDLPKVTYGLIDPAEHAGRAVCVVGGGDSALEAATAIAAEPGTTVTLSYRSGALTRAKRKNRALLEELVAAGRIQLRLETEVQRITESTIELVSRTDPASVETLPNELVIICAGGILPTGFLREVGIEVETKYGTA